MGGVVSCSKCQSLLPAEIYNSPDLSPCPFCRASIKINVFPAFFRNFVPGQAGEHVRAENETNCFYHPEKKAVVHCQSCGRFLCSLCDVEFDNRHLCPSCLETGKRTGKLKNLQNRRMRYDRLALSLAIYPMLLFWLTIITAPITIYIAIRYWKAPLSIVHQTRIRFIIAIFIALIQIGGWTALFVFLAAGKK